jgi:hypothetical protein
MIKIFILFLLLVIKINTYADIPWFYCTVEWKVENNEILKSNNKCFDLVKFIVNDKWKLYNLNWLIIKNQECLNKLKQEISWIINYEIIESYNLNNNKYYSFKIVEEHLNNKLPDPLAISYSDKKNYFNNLKKCYINNNINNNEKNKYIIYYVWVFILLVTLFIMLIYKKLKKYKK